MLKIFEIIDVLKSDFEGKKEYIAYRESECDLDGCSIDEGDTFYFWGNSQKCCKDCFDEIISYLEDEYEKHS
jgi:hypothetical protein